VIAGASPAFWLWFHVAVIAILLIDFFWMQHDDTGHAWKPAAAWTAALVLLTLGFAFFLYFDRGQKPALEFISGYAIELSLSVDNLFVFLLLFQSFGLDAASQRKALGWGVAGAIVMRGLFIVVGVALIQRFEFVQYIFGVFLLIAAIRMLTQKEKHTKPKIVTWMLSKGGSRGSVLLLAIIAIELTDLVFALDSVPAVIAVSKSTFIIYTSNICAILGLRSLYFVLAGMLDKLHLLRYGLGLILAFVGIKMLIEHWYEIPIGISLAIILGTVAVFTIASLLTTPKLLRADHLAGK